MHSRPWDIELKNKVLKFASGAILSLQNCIVVNIEWLIDNQYTKHQFYLQQMLFTYELGSI